MTLADLRNGDAVFIDANIFIYHFGGRSGDFNSASILRHGHILLLVCFASGTYLHESCAQAHCGCGGFFLVVYGLLMSLLPLSRTLDIVPRLQTAPLLFMLLLSSAASSALVVEIIRIRFFRRATWRDKFHFRVVAICWVALFLIQSLLVFIGRSGLSHD